MSLPFFVCLFVMFEVLNLLTDIYNLWARPIGPVQPGPRASPKCRRPLYIILYIIKLLYISCLLYAVIHTISDELGSLFYFEFESSIFIYVRFDLSLRLSMHFLYKLYYNFVLNSKKTKVWHNYAYIYSHSNFLFVALFHNFT